MHLAGRIVVGLCLFFTESSVVQYVASSRFRFGLVPGALDRTAAFIDVGRNFVDRLLNVNQLEVEKDVTFWCAHSSVHRGQTQIKQVLLGDDAWDRKLNASLPLVIFVHGWLDHRNVAWIRYLVDDYLRLVPTNMCIVDWRHLAQNIPFLSSMELDKVAQHTSKFLLSLLNNGFRLENTTLIGFSFGAHIVGITGHLLDGRVERIIGLDPAGLYVTALTRRSVEQRLDRTSGRFVQAIHTEKNILGTTTNMAHQDFYPAGGWSPQPGCIIPILQSGLDFLSMFCSHYAAIDYFRYALNSTNVFLGTKCASYSEFLAGKCRHNEQAVFGIHASAQNVSEGTYYLDVSDEAPYALG